MNYIKVTDDVYVKVDTTRSKAEYLDRVALTREFKYQRRLLEELPEMPSEEELLEWARENHPYNSDIGRSRAVIEAKIAELKADLKEMK